MVISMHADRQKEKRSQTSALPPDELHG